MCDHCGCRSFPQIAELSDEHARILDLAWRVAEHHEAAAHAQLIQLLDDHVAKEELGLYPHLVATGGLDPDVVTVLEAEHSAIDTRAASSWDRRSYYELATHIEQEEIELFPAAMFTFDDTDWDELAVVFEQVTVKPEQAGTR